MAPFENLFTDPWCDRVSLLDIYKFLSVHFLEFGLVQHIQFMREIPWYVYKLKNYDIPCLRYNYYYSPYKPILQLNVFG